MPRRIVIVEPDGLGGLAHFAYQTANALADHGASVTLLTSRHYELAHLPHRCRLDASLPMWPNIAPAPARRLPRWLRVTGHRLRRVVRGVRLAAVWWGLTRRLLRERPDAIQFSSIPFPFLGIFLRRLNRAGLVLTQVCHEYDVRDRGRIARALSGATRGQLYHSFSRIFCLGDSVRDGLVAATGVSPARVQVVRQGDGALFSQADAGGDLRAAYGLQRGAPVALCFGGLRPSKGTEDAIDAFAEVVARIPAARLLVVGPPQANVNPAAYVARAQALGLAEAVTVDPRYVPMEQVAPLMRTATVVVLPYRTATASGVMQVAYACGRPVIVTAVGALADDVAQGETGLVVPAGSRPALSAAMCQLLMNPVLADTMGKAGLARASARHQWAEMTRLVLASTEAAIAERAVT
jgi:glycosyltransferase involved in cell wall biosynthesis